MQNAPKNPVKNPESSHGTYPLASACTSLKATTADWRVSSFEATSSFPGRTIRRSKSGLPRRVSASRRSQGTNCSFVPCPLILVDAPRQCIVWVCCMSIGLQARTLRHLPCSPTPPPPPPSHPSSHPFTTILTLRPRKSGHHFQRG